MSQKKIINRICLHCKNSFLARKQQVERGYAKYCSFKCSIEKREQNKIPNTLCAYCKVIFYRNKSDLKRSKHKIYFCSKEHKVLAQRIGGIKDIQPVHYGTGASRYREIAFNFLPHKCNRCNYNKFKQALVVHHIDRNRNNSKLDNLEILCPTCHAEEHLVGSGNFEIPTSTL